MPTTTTPLPPETAGAIADDLRERALVDGLTKLECAACLESAWVSDPEQIAKLVDHCVFEHGHSQSIVGVRIREFADGYTLADRRGPQSVPGGKISA